MAYLCCNVGFKDAPEMDVTRTQWVYRVDVAPSLKKTLIGHKRSISV